MGAGNLGKETNNDLQNGLITLPLILYFKSCDGKKKMEMKSLLSNSVNGAEQKEIYELLTESGCFREAKNIALDKINFCTNTLNSYPKSKYFDKLIELCEIMGHRSA